jgi:DNA-binding YbaB/EbfC family protein
MGNFGKLQGGGGGGMGNMQAMMKQAQELQKKVQAAQKELDESVLTATAGGGMVTVTVSGKKVLLGIKIDPKAVDPDDIEMLEDLITAAINEGYKKAEELHDAKMGPLTGGLGLF